jgi:glycosyltransferase involved in cell wall biosynthesis
MKNNLSVIIPYFNRSELFPYTYQSLINQTHSKFEVIIVDDGSNQFDIEKTKSLINNDPRFKFIQHGKENMGPSYCRNFGASMANGEHLIFLDSDDLLTANSFENRMKLMNEKTELDFIVFPQHTFYKNIGDSDKSFSRVFRQKSQYLSSFLMDTPPWCITGPIWKKSSFILTGGFDVDLRVMEDPDLHVRAILKGLKFDVQIGEPDFYYRLPKSVSESFYTNSITGRVGFFMKIHESIQDSEYQNKNLNPDLRKGLLSLFKGFLLYRVNEHKKDYITILDWSRGKNILSRFDYLIISLIARKKNGNGLFKVIPANFLIRFLN